MNDANKSLPGRDTTRSALARLLIAGVITCVASGAVRAGYVEDRAAAIIMVQKGKSDEALKMFLAMAETAQTEMQKSDALDQAVQCQMRLNKPEQAMELALQIPSAPVSKLCQMRVMNATRRWQELITKFGGEDISKWPDSVIGDASAERGQAYFYLKDGAHAVVDYQRATEYITIDNDKALAMNGLGDAYWQVLHDADHAVEAYQRTYKTRATYKICHAVIAVAEIRMQQNRPDDAIAEMKLIKMEDITFGLWRGTVLAAWGKVLANAGRKDEAIAKYQEALATPEVAQWTVRDSRQALEKLGVKVAPVPPVENK